MKAKLKRRKKGFFVFVLFCFNGLGQAFDTLVKSPIRYLPYIVECLDLILGCVSDTSPPPLLLMAPGGKLS